MIYQKAGFLVERKRFKRDWYNGCASGFHPDEKGSIPLSRTKINRFIKSDGEDVGLLVTAVGETNWNLDRVAQWIEYFATN